MASGFPILYLPSGICLRVESNLSRSALVTPLCHGGGLLTTATACASAEALVDAVVVRHTTTDHVFPDFNLSVTWALIGWPCLSKASF